jgi:hypothetical protein
MCTSGSRPKPGVPCRRRSPCLCTGAAHIGSGNALPAATIAVAARNSSQHVRKIKPAARRPSHWLRIFPWHGLSYLPLFAINNAPLPSCKLRLGHGDRYSDGVFKPPPFLERRFQAVVEDGSAHKKDACKPRLPGDPMLDKLEFWLLLARERHFGRPAEAAGVTQPTFSSAVKTGGSSGRVRARQALSCRSARSVSMSTSYGCFGSAPA